MYLQKVKESSSEEQNVLKKVKESSSEEQNVLTKS